MRRGLDGKGRGQLGDVDMMAIGCGGDKMGGGDRIGMEQEEQDGEEFGGREEVRDGACTEWIVLEGIRMRGEVHSIHIS